MEGEAGKLSASDIAAWWGAVIATFVFAWDFYKWKTSGAQIEFFISPNMQIVGGGPRDDNTYIVARVINVGDRPTTITHYQAMYYKRWFDKIRKRKSEQFLVTGASQAQPLPYILRPGEIWMGMVTQSDDFVTKSRSGYLFMGVSHSTSKKTAWKRLIVPPEVIPPPSES